MNGGRGAERGWGPTGRRAGHRLALQALGLVVVSYLGATALALVVGTRVDGIFAVCVALVLVCGAVRLGDRFDRLEASALEDPVTRVGSRRRWDASFQIEVERAASARMPLALILLDVDHLKAINDAHGHDCGDRALSLVGNVLRESCRSRDVAARFGGDEFAVLLPRTRASEAYVVAERIRAELARRGQEELAVTVSVGVADLDSAGATTTEALFAATDGALYRAKERGRDRVVVATTPVRSGIIVLDDERRARIRAKGRHVTSA
jgi:two-component system, cell cycle response regulator